MLTKRKQIYAESRLNGLNITESAIAAGCPEKTARQAGSRMEKDRDVQAAMGRISLPAKTEKEKPAKEKKKPAVRPPPIPETVHIPEAVADGDPLKFLTGVMNDLLADPKLRFDAAKAIASFTIAKPGEKGKKEQQNEEAAKVASKFKTHRLKSVS